MNRRQGTWLLAISLLALLIGLVSNMPVAQLLRFGQLPPGLEMHRINGTLVEAHVAGVRFREVVIRDISAKLKPACLVQLKLCYRITATQPRLALDVALSALNRDAVLRDVRIRLPEDAFKQVRGLLVQPTGEFTLSVRNARIAQEGLRELDAILNWANAGIQGEDQALGNYSAQISLENSGLRVELSDQESLLSMQGDALIEARGLYRVDIRLNGQPGLNPSVYSVLDMLAQKTAATRYLIKREGRLPVSLSQAMNRVLGPSG